METTGSQTEWEWEEDLKILRSMWQERVKCYRQRKGRLAKLSEVDAGDDGKAEHEITPVTTTAAVDDAATCTNTGTVAATGAPAALNIIELADKTSVVTETSLMIPTETFRDDIKHGIKAKETEGDTDVDERPNEELEHAYWGPPRILQSRFELNLSHSSMHDNPAQTGEHRFSCCDEEYLNLEQEQHGRLIEYIYLLDNLARTIAGHYTTRSNAELDCPFCGNLVLLPNIFCGNTDFLKDLLNGNNFTGTETAWKQNSDIESQGAKRNGLHLVFCCEELTIFYKLCYYRGIINFYRPSLSRYYCDGISEYPVTPDSSENYLEQDGFVGRSSAPNFGIPIFVHDLLYQSNFSNSRRGTFGIYRPNQKHNGETMGDRRIGDVQKTQSYLDHFKSKKFRGRGGGQRGGVAGGRAKRFRDEDLLRPQRIMAEDGLGGGSAARQRLGRESEKHTVQLLKRLSERRRRASILSRNSVTSYLKTQGSTSKRSRTFNIYYQLSLQKYLDLGWTVLPSQAARLPQVKIIQRVSGVEAQTRKGGSNGAKISPLLDDHSTLNDQAPIVRHYSTGATFLVLFSDGSGTVFHPSGRVAITILPQVKNVSRTSSINTSAVDERIIVKSNPADLHSASVIVVAKTTAQTTAISTLKTATATSETNLQTTSTSTLKTATATSEATSQTTTKFSSKLAPVAARAKSVFITLSEATNSNAAADTGNANVTNATAVATDAIATDNANEDIAKTVCNSTGKVMAKVTRPYTAATVAATVTAASSVSTKATVYAASAAAASCTRTVTRHTYLTHIIQEDSSGGHLRALLVKDGQHMTIHNNDNNIRFLMDSQGGMELESTGAKRRQWKWHPNSCSASIQPIVLSLTQNCALRIRSARDATLSYSTGRHFCRLEVASVDHKPPSTATGKESYVRKEEENSSVSAGPKHIHVAAPIDIAVASAPTGMSPGAGEREDDCCDLNDFKKYRDGMKIRIRNLLSNLSDAASCINNVYV